MSSFTHYWTGQTCLICAGLEGKPLLHTAGNLFAARGVAPGDKIYVVNVLKGELRLIGRMQVNKLTSHTQAERVLGKGLWRAADHLLAVRGSGTAVRFDRVVPADIASQLLFESGKKYEGAKYAAPGMMDRQTLRGVRRLTDSSAQLLDALLAKAG